MKITVQKFDPSVDSSPYFSTYEVPYSEHMTVLSALVYIDENCENLAFDYSCRGRTCGRCSLMLDGMACTACTKGLSDGDHVIEPLRGAPIIRDLVVDKSEMQGQVVQEAQRVSARKYTWDEYVSTPVSEEAAAVMMAADKCAHCMVCTVNCPVMQMMPDRYAGPAVMTAIAMRHCDPFDDADRVASAVSKGLWNCTMCGTCDEACHSYEIDHLGMWAMLREAATARGLTDKATSVLAFGD